MFTAKDLFQFLKNNQSLRVSAGFAISLLPVGVLGLYLKHVYLSKNTGYLLFSRITGEMGVSDLEFMDRLGLFYLDILAFCIILPVAGFLVAQILRGGSRLTVFLIFGIFAVILFYANMQSLGNIGNLLSLNLLMESIQWGLSHPEAIREYIEVSGVIKVLFFAVATVLLVAYADSQSDKLPLSALFNNVRFPLFVSYISLSVVIFLLAMMHVNKYFPQHIPVVNSVVLRFLELDNINETYKNTTKEKKLEAYKDIAKLSDNSIVNSKLEYGGKEKDSNVIVFLMETSPKRSFILNGGVNTLPGMKMLVQQSFIGEKHYSTYPYSSDAVFSIISSTYPAARQNIDNAWKDNKHHVGFFQSLKNIGYFTGTYSPFKSNFGNDASMFEALGVEFQYIAETQAQFSDKVIHQTGEIVKGIEADNPLLPEGQLTAIEQTILHDLDSLSRLKHDIIEQRQKDKKFAMMFLPQIGHAPWIDIKQHDNITERGRAIIELQDKWLVDLLTFLKEESLDKNTIVVITSDHGVRTRKEDSEFTPGYIDDYSFAVPLYIYAPNTIYAPTSINWVTSHIDISPTILALLGLGNINEWDQGGVIWDPKLINRRTFFFAGDYFGANGYHENGNYYMNSIPHNASYKNKALNFHALMPLIEHDFIQENINEISGLTKYWGVE